MSRREPVDEEDIEATLEAYEREKWAQLSEMGPEHLRRELANLERFLDQADTLDWASDELVRFRRGKARILRTILADAESA